MNIAEADQKAVSISQYTIAATKEAVDVAQLSSQLKKRGVDRADIQKFIMIRRCKKSGIPISEREKQLYRTLSKKISV